ncbi:Protein of unknown function [Pedobacter westerhofensis]|uniref:DUF2931 family protein n=1 Tax=Pedobacter westerhofensis TaxID=425512 RepID=A0A521BGT9_9SPHI|nr:DUF2931 family protein [Pedobacter westerhofensis]SMO46337.1 Protein of unknown function [Pedobacter westerhofensis]
MKRLLILTVAIGSFTISACQEKMKKYDWIPTECAPKDYPVQIYSGHFYYGDKGSIYVPDGRAVNYGWGEEGSINIAGDKFKESPHTLELTWISFTEKKNYFARFNLDTKKIDSLFAAGYPTDVGDGKGTYHEVKVGMAPGGYVVLWLTAERSKQVEVGQFRAKVTGELDWKKVYPDMGGTFDEYSNAIVSDLSDTIKQQMKDHTIPMGYWESLRKRYLWKPVIESTAEVKRIDFDYANKERDFIFGEALNNITVKPTAVIEELSVYWLDDKKRELRTEIKFNEQEAFKLFSEIKDDGEGQLVVHLNKDKPDATVEIKYKGKQFVFEELKVKSFYR